MAFFRTVPSVDELSALPHRARVASAARCALRVLPLISARREIDAATISLAVDAVRRAEDVASGLSPAGGRSWLHEELYSRANKMPFFDANSDLLEISRSVVLAAANCAAAAWYPVRGEAEFGCSTAVHDTFMWASEALYHGQLLNLWPATLQELHFLGATATRRAWDHDTLIPKSIYLLHTDLGQLAAGDQISILREIAEPWAESNRAEAGKRLSVSFERLVADICTRLGWDVELTARTRDGGRDIVAVQHLPTRSKYLIECKLWRGRVGVAVVRALLGTVESEGATKGVLVTAHGVTAPARHLLERHRWRLEARDLEGLLLWLDECQRIQRAREVKVDVADYLRCWWKPAQSQQHVSHPDGD